MYLLCRSICTFNLEASYGQHIIPYRPTFAFSQAANLDKTVSKMPFFGIKYHN